MSDPREAHIDRILGYEPGDYYVLRVWRETRSTAEVR